MTSSEKKKSEDIVYHNIMDKLILVKKKKKIRAYLISCKMKTETQLHFVMIFLESIFRKEFSSE